MLTNKEIYEEFKEMVSGVKIYINLEDLPIGTMFEILWHIDTDMEEERMFILTNKLVRIEVINEAKYRCAELYDPKRATYQVCYWYDIQRWQRMNKLKFIHIPEEIENDRA